MNKLNRKFLDIFVRYIFILVSGLGNLAIFYFIFTKPTVLLSNFFLNLISQTILLGNSIIFREVLINLVPACIAGSAYFLLFILAFSVSNLKILKRIGLVAFLFIGLFLFNTLRIVILSLITKIDLFNEVHLVFWYFVSTVFVVILWFIAVKILKIKSIPVYSDFKFLISNIRLKKRKYFKRSKKNS